MAIAKYDLLVLAFRSSSAERILPRNGNKRTCDQSQYHLRVAVDGHGNLSDIRNYRDLSRAHQEKIVAWPKPTQPRASAVVEQSGFFVVRPDPHGREFVDRHIVVPKFKIPELIKQLREAAKS